MTKQNGNDLLSPSIEDIDMIVFDVDGTLMDRDGMPPGMVGLMKETESRGYYLAGVREDIAKSDSNTPGARTLRVHYR